MKTIENRSRNSISAFLSLFAITLAVIVITLFFGDNVFLSDNGDFGRIMCACSLYRTQGEIRIALVGNTLLHRVANVLFSIEGLGYYPSSQVFFTRAAVALNLIINAITGASPDAFHLTYLGLIYSVLYAAAVSFALCQITFKTRGQFCLFCIPALVVLCDIAYISYFNSLYGEALQHILLILLTAYFLRLFKNGAAAADCCIFYFVLAVYGTAKSFNIPCAVLFGAVYLLVLFSKTAAKKQRTVASIAAGMSLLILTISFLIIPQWIKCETNYNSVFFGILRHSSDVEAQEALAALGLERELYALKDTNRYVSNIAQIEAQYDLAQIDGLSYIDLLGYYMRHPIKTLRLLPHIAKYCGVLRNQFFLDCSYLNEPYRLSIWSHIRESSGFNNLWFNILLLCVFSIAFYGMLRRKTSKKTAVLTVLLLLLAVAYSAISPYIANGEGDLGKHMFSYMELADVAFLVSVYALFCSDRLGRILSCGIMIATIGFVIVSNIHSSPDTIHFGRYNGQELNWIVLEETEEYKTLICETVVDTLSYSSRNSNDYEDADIRVWLNGAFLEEFTADERGRLIETKHKVLYSAPYRISADMGTRDFYCCLYPELAARGYDTAYGSYVSDLVMLPNVTHIEAMTQQKLQVADGVPYWLETCYYNNGEKVRYVNTDGMIHFDLAAYEKGVRPVIRIR